MKNETWKPLVGYESIYLVSNFGNIYSYYSNKVIKPQKNNHYYYITACNGSSRKNIVIHRAVAMTFIPNPLNLPQVNHKDGNKLNNNLNNLEWCTPSQNSIHAYKNNLRQAKMGVESNFCTKLNSFHVTRIRDFISKGVKQSYIAKLYNCHINTICDIGRRKIWKHI